MKYTVQLTLKRAGCVPRTVDETVSLSDARKMAFQVKRGLLGVYDKGQLESVEIWKESGDDCELIETHQPHFMPVQHR
jgi:hypothetical protein